MKKFFLFALGICLFASCAKNVDEDGQVNATKQKMLMDKAWQLRGYMIDPDINDSTDIPVNAYTPIPDCKKDNYLIFNDDHTVSEYDHYIKCAMTDPDTVAYNYSLTNNENHLMVWSNPDDVDHSVVMDGDMTYPSIDTFILTFQVYDSIQKITSEHVQTFVKYIPD